MQSSVILIGGMHRSGTSLGASVLNDSGLSLGKNLIKANKANQKGFFENADFVNLHKEVLTSQGLQEDGFEVEHPLSIPEEFEAKVDRILDENQSDRLWGWKDPRNTLFLNYWAEKIPQAKFILLFRSPWEVLDSLFRRGDKLFIEKPHLSVESWTVFNRFCLEFYSQNPDRTIIIHLPQLVRNHAQFIKVTNEKFSIDLKVPDGNNFDSSILKTEVSNSSKPALIKKFFPDCYKTWLELNQAGIKFGAEEFSYLEELDGQELIHDWMTTRKSQRERDVSNKLLFEKGDALWAAEEELRVIKGSRIWKLRNQISHIRDHFI